MKNKAIDKYMIELKRQMPKDYKNAGILMDSISRDIESYLLTNTNVDYNEICKEFGTPKDLILCLMDSMDSSEIEKVFVRKKNMKSVIYVLCVIITFFVILFCVAIPNMGIYITDTVYINNLEES